MKECTKSINRRLRDSRFVRNYFVGKGIDMGGKPDPLSMYLEFFPLAESVKIWDLDDGDAQYLEGVPDESYDFVHSSHCLEHLGDPTEGLQNWMRILRPDGYMIITVPDEDLYEQGEFPSTFNSDHRWSFTIYKPTSWSNKSINVMDLLRELGENAAVEKIELLNSNYLYRLPRYDQTLLPVCESAIEIIIRKRSIEEVNRRGLRVFPAQPDRDLRVHLNQYKDDIATMKKANRTRPPFTNEGEI